MDSDSNVVPGSIQIVSITCLSFVDGTLEIEIQTNGSTNGSILYQFLDENENTLTDYMVAGPITDSKTTITIDNIPENVSSINFQLKTDCSLDEDSGDGDSGAGEAPAPPSSPDQHILWPPVRNLGNNNWVLVDQNTPPDWKTATNPWRDIYDENLIENKWTLFYFEIRKEENISYSDSDSGDSVDSDSNYNRTISAIWVKRKASVLWPGGNVFYDYYTYGNPTGLVASFRDTGQPDIVADSGARTPLYFSGSIQADNFETLERVGGYLIEKIKYITDNNYSGDGSYRIMGPNVNVLPMGDILSVPVSTSFEDLDTITISLLNSN